MSNEARSHAWPALQASANALSTVIAIVAIAIASWQSIDCRSLEERIERLENQSPQPIVWPPGQNTDPVPWWRHQGRLNRGEEKIGDSD
tara:strand:- start:61 stop:327 length:267 start_codon:yes stop_codon:yes gene_type:complete